MNKYKKMMAIGITGLLVSGSLVGCTVQQDAIINANTTSEESSTQEKFTQAVMTEYKEIDLNSDYGSGINILLEGNTVSAQGDGVTVTGSVVEITQAGTYIISGSVDDGQIIVNTDTNSDVWLVLKDADITCLNSAPIYVKQANNVVITIEGENKVTDSTQYVLDDGDEPNATIFSKSDLTFNGEGTLNVAANYNNGITSKDDLVITSGNINVTAVNDGIKGRDSISVLEGNITIEAEGDGMQSNNDEDTQKGYIVLDGGTYKITAENDGIQAETSVQINGGGYEITSGGGSINAVEKAEEFMGGGRMMQEQQTAATVENTESYKGIKGTNIAINGGTFNINSADDALHSNGNITVNSGVFTIATGDDGIHADDAVVINNGQITINESYEGIEGSTITIEEGSIDITADDDGINVAGGNDSTAQGGRFGGDNFAENSSQFLAINGGDIYIDAMGDGIDINGSGTMIGGTVYVSGSSSGGNGSLDIDGEFSISAGVLIATGGAQMAQSLSTNSSQPSFILHYTTSQSGEVVIKDESGATVISYTPPKEYTSLVATAPQFKDGSTYTVYANEKKVTDITLSGTVTSISDTGQAVTSMGGRGAQPPRDAPNGERTMP